MSAKISVGVYLASQMPNNDLSSLAKELEASFGCVCHLLDNGAGIAVNFTNCAVERGTSEEKMKDLRQQENISRFIYSTGHLRSDSLPLWLPAYVYDCHVALPLGETGGRFLQTGVLAPWRGEPRLQYEMVYPDMCSARTRAKLYEVIRQWHVESCTLGFGGELLADHAIEMVDDSTRPGFSVFYPTARTFPWVELYLRIRSRMEKREWPKAMMFSPIATTPEMRKGA